MKALKLFSIFLILFLVSCSVKKRTYRDGYYIDWAFHNKTSTPKAKVVSEKQINSPLKEVIETEYVTASKASDPETESFVPGKSKVVLIDTCGDVITFKSGDQVTARVTEITDDKIKYKRCDNLDGPVFVVNKGTVETIRYANGVVEKIEAPVPVYNSDPYTKPGNTQNTFKAPRKVHPKAIWALLALIFLFWLFGLGILLGGILSYYAIKEINEKPDVYKGMGLAKTVYVICKVLTSIILGAIILGSLFN